MILLIITTIQTTNSKQNMKKVFISFVLCCISIVGMAQTDVTKFLGIPVDGDKSEMISKLKSKGFAQSPYGEDILTGVFNGTDVNVVIDTNNDKVCRIMVSDANSMDEANIRIRFNVLCEQFKNNSRYCSLHEDDQKLKDDEDISYEMNANKKRYQAVFYQIPDTSAVSFKEGVQSLIHSKYTKEQLENPSEEISEDVYRIGAMYALEKIVKKPVWFMISEEEYGKYYITMYYDNEYNRANGEDL